MGRFPEFVTLTGEEAFVLLGGVEDVVAELTERGELDLAVRLEDAVADLRRFVGGSDVPPAEDSAVSAGHRSRRGVVLFKS